MSINTVITELFAKSRLDRILVSFFYKENNRIYHFGTGFVYSTFIKNKEYKVIITAAHVIQEAINSGSNTYISICIDNYQYAILPFETIEFHCLYEEDSAFGILPKEFSREYNVLAITNKTSLYDLPDIIPNYRVLFGYPASDNSGRLLPIDKFKLNWTILHLSLKENMDLSTSIKTPIFIDYEYESMFSNEEDTLGSPPSLKGMSGCPSFIIKINSNNQLEILVDGILIEQLKTPPINGKILLTSPLAKILDLLYKIIN